MKLFNWIRRCLGFHVHDWTGWTSKPAGYHGSAWQERDCKTCGFKQQEILWHPYW